MFFKTLIILTCSMFLLGCSKITNNDTSLQNTNTENNVDTLDTEQSSDTSNEQIWYKNYILDRIQNASNALELILNQSNSNHDNSYIQAVNASLDILHSIANDLQHETNIPVEYLEFHNAFLQCINNSIVISEQLLRNETTNVLPLKENYDMLLALIYQYNI